MKKCFLTILVLVFLNSCYDPNIVDPSKVEAKLTIIVYGKDNLLAKNAEVTVKTEHGKAIVVDSTNENGQFNMQLLEGNYIIETKIYVDKVYYMDSKYLQIIGGLDKVAVLKPFEKVGDIIRIVLNSKRKPISGINVTLLTAVFDHQNAYSFEDCNQFAYITDVSDANGKITFKNIPIGFTFGLLMYKNELQYEYYQHNISVLDGNNFIYTDFN